LLKQDHKVTERFMGSQAHTYYCTELSWHTASIEHAVWDMPKAVQPRLQRFAASQWVDMQSRKT